MLEQVRGVSLLFGIFVGRGVGSGLHGRHVCSSMIPSHVVYTLVSFFLFPPYASLMGDFGVGIFQHSRPLEFKCTQLTLDVSSHRNSHLPKCS